MLVCAAISYAIHKVDVGSLSRGRTACLLPVKDPALGGACFLEFSHERHGSRSRTARGPGGNGSVGKNYGGGGGGGVLSGGETTYGSGAAGAPGIVVVEEYYRFDSSLSYQ